MHSGNKSVLLCLLGLLRSVAVRATAPCITPTPDPRLQHQRGVLLQHGGPTGALQVGRAAKGVREAASGAVFEGHPGLLRTSE